MLAGVVPCPSGWLAATAKLQGITISPEDPQVFSELLAVLDYKPAFDVVALFCPVGLPDSSVARGRRCDRDARRLLGWPRSGAVVSAPGRDVVTGVAQVGKGPSLAGMSAISRHRARRIAEVDQHMAPYWQRTVVEVHAEMSFYQLNDDRPLRFSKRKNAGIEERRLLLEARIPGVERILDARLRGVRVEHLADAAACLWTARRIVSRAVERVPEDPEWDSMGLRMEIVR